MYIEWWQILSFVAGWIAYDIIKYFIKKRLR
jgi:hypothetical protein